VSRPRTSILFGSIYLQSDRQTYRDTENVDRERDRPTENVKSMCNFGLIMQSMPLHASLSSERG